MKKGKARKFITALFVIVALVLFVVGLSVINSRRDNQNTVDFGAGWTFVLPEGRYENVDLDEFAFKTLQRGDTFTIEDWRFDTKGHKAGVETHTVKIPQGSLTQTTSKSDANVLTTISFVPTTGAITVDRTNIQNLTLTGWTLGSNRADIAATDTLGQALGKIQNQLNALDNATHFRGVVTSLDDITDPIDGDIVYVGVKEYIYYNNKWNEMGDETIYVTKAAATVNNISVGASQTLTGISQTNGVIAAVATPIQISTSQVTSLDDSLDAIDTSLTTINNTLTTIKGNGWSNETIKGNATNIANEITRASGIEAGLDNRIKALEDEDLATKYADLLAKYNALEARVAALEPIPEEE